jgi:hypothetical protein
MSLISFLLAHILDTGFTAAKLTIMPMGASKISRTSATIGTEESLLFLMAFITLTKAMTHRTIKPIITRKGKTVRKKLPGPPPPPVPPWGAPKALTVPTVAKENSKPTIKFLFFIFSTPFYLLKRERKIYIHHKMNDNYSKYGTFIPRRLLRLQPDARAF